VVLAYHRVTTLERDPQLLAVTPDHFREQMLYLKENFSVGRIEDAWDALPAPGVVVTFDDGYADNALEALPILEELGVPATFFVTPALVESRCEFWWDELERVILEATALPEVFNLPQELGARRWPTASQEQRQRFYRELHPVLKRALPDAREKCLEELRAWAGLPSEGRGSHRALALDELRRLADSPLVTLGAHSMTHPSLAALPADRQRQEILGSKTWLEEFIGRQVAVFSYPFGGRTDYSAETVRICREAGFTRATSNFPGQWLRSTDPLQIPRHLVRNWGQEQFAKELAGFWTA